MDERYLETKSPHDQWGYISFVELANILIEIDYENLDKDTKPEENVELEKHRILRKSKKK